MDARERSGLVLLAIVIVGSGLALGSIHTEVLAVWTAVASAAVLLLAPKFDATAMSRSAKVIVFAIVGLTAWTALQLVPLPMGLLRWIASENADVWSRSLSPLRESGPAFAPLSVDPTATRVQVLRGLTYLAVFVAAVPTAAKAEGRSWLQRILVVATVAMAAAAVAHPALSIQRVFLVYEPKETYAYDPAHIAPLLNTNHLAAYVNIGALLALAAIFERGDARVLPRPVALVVSVLLGALTIWTGSRGGFAALVIGTLVVVLLSFRQRGRAATSVASVIAVTAAASVFLLSAFDVTKTKLATNNLTKLDLAKRAMSLLADYGIFGAGRGTFESVFPKIREGNDYVVFTHPENVIAQWTTEWGVPVSLAAFAALVWALQPKRVLRDDDSPIGPWAALLAVSAHNLVDFSSEIPGVMIALTTCAAIVTGRPASTVEEARSPREVQRNFQLRIAGTVVIAVSVMATLWTAEVELHNEQRAFTALGLNKSVTREEFHARARSALLRHPADPYIPFVGAVRAAATRDESILPWAARALERSPVYGRVHLLLGRMLHPRNHAQARLEYRLACLEDALTCAAPEMLSLVGSYEEALELVPNGERGAAVLEFLINGVLTRLPSSAARLERELRARDPSALGPLRRIATAAASDLSNEDAWCSDELRADCIAQGAEAAHTLVLAAPLLCDGYQLTAFFKRAAGDTVGAFDQFEAAVPLVEHPGRCAQHLLELARETKESALVDRAVARMENSSCDTPEECAENLVLAARAESMRGNRKRALVLLQKAWEIRENDQLLDEIGETAEAEGLHAQAAEAYTKLTARHPDDPTWTKKLDRARTAATAQRFQPPRLSPPARD